MQLDLNRVSFEANPPIPLSHNGDIDLGSTIDASLYEYQQSFQRTRPTKRQEKSVEERIANSSQQPDLNSIQGSYRQPVPIQSSKHQQDILTNFSLDVQRSTSITVQTGFPESADAWDVLESLIGTIDGPTDWASQHDHYLYGTPKRR